MNELGVQQSVPAKAQTSAPDKKVANMANNAEATQRQADVADAKSEAKAEQAAEAKESSVQEAVSKLNDYVQSVERKLEFQVDDDSGDTVVKVYDKNSQELIRQMPNEEALELSQRLNAEEPLMLFSAKV